MSVTVRLLHEELAGMVRSTDGLDIGRGLDTVVADVEHDSRSVHPDVLFACIPGRSTDGHDHAPAAIAAGAVALLVERRLGLEVPEILVDEVRAAVGPAAAAVHGHPSASIDVVGITGTNGKTTTVRLVSGLLTGLGRRCLEIGTLTASSIPLSRATANTSKVEAQRLKTRFAQAPSSPGNKLRFHRATVKRVWVTQDNGLAAMFRTRRQPQPFQRPYGTVDKYFFASTGHVGEIMRQGWG